MKKFFILFLINFILVLLQTAFFPVLIGAKFNPNLVLAFAIALFVLDRPKASFASALLGGLLLDLVGFTVPGVSAFIFVSLLLLLFYVRRYIFKGWGIVILSVYIFCAVYLFFIEGAVDFESITVLQISSTTLVAVLLFYFVIRKILDEANLI